MLSLLRVQNLAIIESLELELGPGLNVLTGETGAGKSILVAALGLVLGARGRSELVRTGADRAVVEGLFDIRDARLAARLDAAGVEAAGELVVRRELLATGRTRAYVNGRLTTAAQLKALARGLVDISSQHQHHTLVDPSTHLDHLDAFAALAGMRSEVAATVAALRAGRAAWDAAKTALQGRAEREDLLRFQLAEVEALAPAAGEDGQLVEERERLAHGARLLATSSRAHRALYAAEDALCARVSRLVDDVVVAGSHDPRLAELGERLSGAQVELREAALDLGRYAERLDADPARLGAVEERLDALRRVVRKHGEDVAALLAWRDAAHAELADLEAGEDRLEKLQGELGERGVAALAAADGLSAARKAAADELGRAISQELASLGMGGARVAVSVDAVESGGLEVQGARLTASGRDRVEFLIAPNPGEAPRPLARVASGGELSRALLALKRVLAEGGPVGLYVFDEVDTGVGGAVAEVIGHKLADVAAHHQVLCITHAPQVGAFGNRHLHVHKVVEGGRTFSRVRALDAEERVHELARMLGGIDVSPATRQAARDLRSAAIRRRRTALAAK